MKKPYLIAIGFTLVLVLWMLSGLFVDANVEEKASIESDNRPLFTVEVEEMFAVKTPLYLKIQGQSDPNRMVEVRSQIDGLVNSIDVLEGSLLEQNVNMITLDIEDRRLQLAEQESLLKVRQNTNERLSKLATKQYQSENEIEQAKANIKASEAAIAQIKQAISFTNIATPFRGYLQKLHIEEGDFVRIGDVVATYIETDPLIVEIQISQQDIEKIKMGDLADIALATGQVASGKVTYIAPKANDESRTFSVELTVENPDNRYKAGISAQVTLATNEVKAHYITPSLFSLNKSGAVGVKTVDALGVVKFHPIQLLQSDTGGSWVSGLPDKANVIVTGQGFVSEGTTVKVVKTTQANGTRSSLGVQ